MRPFGSGKERVGNLRASTHSLGQEMASLEGQYYFFHINYF
jgi:hypothetical protein